MGEPLYYLLQVAGIIFFAYFYTSIVFNPVDTADNMRKYGGFIPGIRPGKRTSDYIDRVLTRITFVGALYLAAVCIIPEFLISGIHVAQLPFGIGAALDRILPLWFTEGMGLNFYFGGTSLLIVVGVAMDTMQQIESQLVMRHYDGFMKKGRIRGRRGMKDDTLEDHLHRTAGQRQGNSGEAAREPLRDPAHLDGRHAPRGGGRRHRARAAGGADHGVGRRSCPDDLMIGIINDRLAKPDAQNGLHPGRLPAHARAGGEARRIVGRGMVKEAASGFSNCSFPTTPSSAASLMRRTCAQCGAIYHLENNPPANDSVCDRCGAEVIARPDDTEEAVRKRLESFHRQTMPVATYYKAKSILAGGRRGRSRR